MIINNKSNGSNNSYVAINVSQQVPLVQNTTTTAVWNFSILNFGSDDRRFTVKHVAITVAMIVVEEAARHGIKYLMNYFLPMEDK